MIRPHTWRVLVFCLSPMLFGTSCTCGGNAFTEIAADDYTRSCSENDDCMLAIDWNACNSCPPCGNSAINITSRARYERDLRRAERLCIPTGSCSKGCDPQVARCVDGVCDAFRQVFFFPSILDTSCTEDSDCVGIPRGDACTPCSCDVAAVNVNALDNLFFPTSSEDIECGTSVTTSCAPCADTRAVCDEGQCALVDGP